MSPETAEIAVVGKNLKRASFDEKNLIWSKYLKNHKKIRFPIPSNINHCHICIHVHKHIQECVHGYHGVDIPSTI